MNSKNKIFPPPYQYRQHPSGDEICRQENLSGCKDIVIDPGYTKKACPVFLTRFRLFELLQKQKVIETLTGWWLWYVYRVGASRVFETLSLSSNEIVV